MFLDENNILSTAKKDVRENGKVYTHLLESLAFHAQDHEVMVYHKGSLKKTNRKDLGQKMNCIIRKNYHHDFSIDKKSIAGGLQLYQGYDEDSDESYCYFPKCKIEFLQKIEKKVKKLLTNVTRGYKNKQYVMYKEKDEQSETIEDIKTDTNKIINFFLGLSIVYGHFNIKNDIVNNIKIQIPLIGSTVSNKENLDQMITHLQSEQLYCKYSFQTHHTGINYQITINDYEILKRLCKQNKSIENIEKIYKYELAEQVRKRLVLKQCIESHEIEGTENAGLIKILEK